MRGSFREAELAGWAARASSYDRHLSPVTNQVIAPILATLAPLAGMRVLDVCCGPGHLAGAAAAAGAVVEGVDFAPPMVAKACESHPGLAFREGDAEALPYADGAFDHVVCAFGLMHVSRPDVAVAEAFRVLRPQGRYVFTQWAKDDEVLGIVLSAIAAQGAPVANLPDAPPPLRFSDPLECRRVLERAGFADVRIERIETAWTGEQPAALLDLVYGGAVRVAIVMEAQEPAGRARIHAAILEAAKARTSGGTVVLRRPVVMASSVKPGKK
jgi:ubiquinone/menaquinone biosynthesis C-methylase UbiE